MIFVSYAMQENLIIYDASSDSLAVLQGFDFTSTKIDLGAIREKIATFIVSQIIEPNGEFHCVVCNMDN